MLPLLIPLLLLTTLTTPSALPYLINTTSLNEIEPHCTDTAPGYPPLRRDHCRNSLATFIRGYPARSYTITKDLTKHGNPSFIAVPLVVDNDNECVIIYDLPMGRDSVGEMRDLISYTSVLIDDCVGRVAAGFNGGFVFLPVRRAGGGGSRREIQKVSVYVTSVNRPVGAGLSKVEVLARQREVLGIEGSGDAVAIGDGGAADVGVEVN